MRRQIFILLAVMFLSIPARADNGSLEIFDKLKSLIISVSDSIKPAVVHIEVVKKKRDQRFESMGSGLVVDKAGYILTNEHVVDDHIEITVALESNREYQAEVIGVDKLTDLALIKIEVPEEIELTAAQLGDSDSVQVGEWVIAVGNPYGFDRSVSFGIVSGKGRVLNIPSLTPLINDFIQTDAAIAPGSSGGPLVNLRGEVIGINSRGVGRTQGFTIPINIAIEVKNKILASGKIERGWLGLILQPLNRSFAEYLGDPELEGILIADIEPGSPSEKAGLQPGDVILDFDGEKYEAEKDDDLNSFTLAVSRSEVGEKKDLQIFRDGKEKNLNITVGEKPKVKEEEFEAPFGFTVKEITDNVFRTYLLETKEGVFVSYVEIGGVAAKGHLYEGDTIIEVNRDKVSDFGAFKKLVEKYEDDKFVLFKVIRGKDHRFALMDMSKAQQENVEDDNNDDEIADDEDEDLFEE
ncbi:MAG: trypsin-like peptidase domain-containing protein [Candidatus Zixiibacteriota bacterium]|nr:MAG: trypsin-like peptidase domain-containing protein [candidate division Zixibacteria bacterium]